MSAISNAGNAELSVSVMEEEDGGEAVLMGHTPLLVDATDSINTSSPLLGGVGRACGTAGRLASDSHGAQSPTHADRMRFSCWNSLTLSPKDDGETDGRGRWYCRGGSMLRSDAALSSSHMLSSPGYRSPR